MTDNRIPNPSFLTSTAEESYKEYRKEILEGKFMRNIINGIETAALDGYKGWRTEIFEKESEKDYEIVQEALRRAGYKCEIKTEKRNNLIFKNNTITERHFIVRWGK